MRVGHVAIRRPAAPRGRPGRLLRVVAAVGLVLGVLVGFSATSPPHPPVATHIRTGDVVETHTWGFAGGTAGWQAGNAATSLSWVPASARGGGGALQMISGAPGTLAATAPAVRAEPGLRYSATGWIGPASTLTGRVGGILTFRSASGAVTAQLWGQGVPANVGSPARLAPVVGMAPRGTATVQFEVAVFGAPAGVPQHLDQVRLTATEAGAPAVTGPLSTRGNLLLDGAGQRMVLRGIQRFGLEGGAPGNPPPTDAEIGQLAAWGTTVVRISLGEQYWVPSSCQYNPAYPAEVDAVVHSVTSRGMVALLDLHYVTATACSRPGLLPMADAARAIPFWQSVAARYAANPLVAFDLFNEPHGITPAVWLDGGPVRYRGSTYQAAGMQQLYDAVRATGARNVVVASGMNWAEQPPTQPIAGFNVVYGVHAYTCPRDPPPLCTTRNPYDPAPILGRWTAFAASHPVMVTEFGWPDRRDGTYLGNVIAYAEARGWGWDAFCFDGSTGGQFSLLGGIARDGVTYEPDPAGMPVLAGLAANRP